MASLCFRTCYIQISVKPFISVGSLSIVCIYNNVHDIVCVLCWFVTVAHKLATKSKQSTAKYLNLSNMYFMLYGYVL